MAEMKFLKILPDDDLKQLESIPGEGSTLHLTSGKPIGVETPHHEKPPG